MEARGPIHFDPFLPRGQKRPRSQFESEDQDRFHAGPSNRSSLSPSNPSTSRHSPHSTTFLATQPLGSRCPFAQAHSRRLAYPPIISPDSSPFDPPPSRRQARAEMPPTTRSIRPDVGVIDLTCEDSEGGSPVSGSGSLGDASRGPRFANDIIDISGDSPPQEHSPEVQFVSSRPRVPPPPRRRIIAGVARIIPAVVSVDEDDDVEIQITGSNVLNRNQGLNTHTTSVSNSIERFMAAALGSLTANTQALGDLVRSGTFVHPAPDFQFVDPSMDLGYDRRETASPRSYTAPPKAPEGFTRSPEENETLVCPNCGDELCTGDSDLKKQVWVLKGCGHVYCGECTQGRFISKQKKAKAPAKTKPFRECVVADCNIRTTASKAMIQLFL